MDSHSRSGKPVFGPLPPLHRVLVVITVLAVGVVAGVWIVRENPEPTLVAAGVGWGLIAGLVLTFFLLHDFHHRTRPVRVRRH
jgi:di/tricarboxylate transporter